MKRLKIIFGVVIVLGITIAVLLSNKSRMQARSKNDEIKFLPVSVVDVGKQKLSETLSLVGTITANNDVAIAAETQGKVIAVRAQIGDYVKAGAIIVQLDDELKRAAYATAEVNYQKIKKDLERYETLMKDNSVSDAQLEGAKLAFKSAEAQYIIAKRQYNDTKIKSPISGIITARPVDIGSNVQINSIVANVVDISKLKVRLNVSEEDAFRLKAGDKIAVSTEVYPGEAFEGKITSISSKADDAHTYPVEVILPNNGKHPLKAGMFGRITFVSVKDNESLTIPREALLGSMKNAQVFVVENGIAKLRNIVVGSKVGTNLEVLTGITLGESIVVNGQNNLKDNVAVNVVK